MQNNNYVHSVEKQLKLIHYNCNSAQKSKLKELKAIVHEKSPSIMCLQETWWSKDHKISFPGYYVARSDRDRRGGGVATLVKQTEWAVVETVDLKTELQHIECVLIKCVSTLGKKMSIANVYNNRGNQSIKDDLAKVKQRMNGSQIICGDFNAHSQSWETGKLTNRAGSDINDFLSETSDMCLLTPIDLPTYSNVQGTYSSTIDLTFVSIDIMAKTTIDINSELDIGSPHRAIEVVIDVRKDQYHQRTEISNWKDLNWEKFREECEGLINENTGNIESDAEHLITTLTKAATKSVKQQKTQGRKRKLHGWNTEVQDMVLTRRKMKRELNRRFTIDKYLEYKKQQAKVTQIIMDLQRKTWRNYCEKFMNHNTPVKKMWKMFHRISGTGKSQKMSVLQNPADKTTISDSKEKANFIAKVLQNKRKQGETFTQKQKEQFKKIEKQYLKSEDQLFKLLEAEDLQKVIDKLPLGKTPGKDMISAEMLQKIGDKTFKFLLDLCNNCISKAEVPKIWSTSVIIPILKPGKNQVDPRIVTDPFH